MKQLTDKEYKFNEALQSAKRALDRINIPFHLMAGTALGSHREKSFIPHDEDIDLAVFYRDVNTNEKVKQIKYSMMNEGFIIEDTLGQLKRGKEILFVYEKYDVHLDIFWVYEGNYKGKDYYLVSSYFGDCDELKYKTCIWAYRPYDVVRKRMLGKTYNVVPKSTLIDMYGKDWKIPKKFSYEEGIRDGGYKGFIRDYYDPKIIDKKVAYCFLINEDMEDEISKQWVSYFNTDNYTEKEFNIYSSIFRNTKAPKWLKDKRIRGNNVLINNFINIIKEAYEDNLNKYIVIVGYNNIPINNYWDTHKNIFKSRKSCFNIIDNVRLSFGKKMLISSSSFVLTRHCAKIIIDMYNDEINNIGKVFGDRCMEVIPINMLYGEFGSEYKKHIRNCILFE